MTQEIGTINSPESPQNLEKTQRRIVLRLEEQSFPLTVWADEEPLYRRAQNRIERILRAYQMRYPFSKELPANSYLIMTCIDLAFRLEKMLQEQKNEVDLSQRLEQLNQEIENVVKQSVQG